ncbi:unnamed protein product [Linum trigynum]|uniref:Uncharacterized protein n=1 Tax=Linum trigynum TaxID=586398 RepID=A0AAV2DCS5_9ROSI
MHVVGRRVSIDQISSSTPSPSSSRAGKLESRGPSRSQIGRDGRRVMEGGDWRLRVLVAEWRWLATGWREPMVGFSSSPTPLVWWDGEWETES